MFKVLIPLYIKRSCNENLSTVIMLKKYSLSSVNLNCLRIDSCRIEIWCVVAWIRIVVHFANRVPRTVM